MILLLGGTSETKPIAMALADAGHMVLVSTATEISLDTGSHPNISRRSGRLSLEGLTGLVEANAIRAIVDATHPYASQVRREAEKAAGLKDIPYFTFVRSALVEGGEGIVFAGSHEEASRMVFSTGKPVLLTIGSKNLKPYVRESRATNVPMIVRVLSDANSMRLCREAGVKEDSIVTGRGPFSIEENRKIISRYAIGVIVMKDSGREGGTLEKLEAARLEGCRAVVIRRPRQQLDNAFSAIPDMISAVSKSVL